MSKVVFQLNRDGGAEILRNNLALQPLQYQAITSILGIIEAEFLQTFGRQGRFRIVEFTTDRYSVKIQADDAQTGAVLKANPKWLDQFTDNMKI